VWVLIGVQKDRLSELRRANSKDAERAQLKKNLLSVTRQRADVAQQYAVRIHPARGTYASLTGCYTQGLVRIAIKDQIDATKLGLEYLQENSRKSALELLLEERDGEYQKALAEFNTGLSPCMSGFFCSLMCGGFAYAANAVYIETKERSKELLDISKAKLDEVDEELRRTFQTMEEVRLWPVANDVVVR
jgi:structural maintenance of chromosomes protein 5